MGKLFRYLAPFHGAIAIVLVLAFAQAIGFLLLPRLMSEIVDHGIVRGDRHAILQAGGVMLLISIAATACAVAGSYYAAKVATGVGRALRLSIFTHVEHLSIHQFERIGAASLVTRTTNDTTQVQQMLIQILTAVVTAPMMAVGGVILARSQDTQLAWVLVAVMPVLGIAFGLIMRSALPLSQAMQGQIDQLNRLLGEALSGVRVIRAFDRGEWQRMRFDAANRDVTNTAIVVNRLMACLMPVLIVTINLTNAAILWVGSHRIAEGLMQVGAMIASLQYAIQILFAVFTVTTLFVMLPRAAASALRIKEVLELGSDTLDPAQPRPQSTDGGVRGVVEFRNVSVQYPGAEEPAVTSVTLTARPGEVIAVIGGTGSGKSTLAGLIPRFYDVSEGAVLVDGVDVREMRQLDLRSRIGYVPQQAVLFTGTIAANIRCGCAHADDEDVRQAASVAQALEFVEAMPQQFESAIAQGGVNLSGGQKQRLSIARAIVRRPEIYVFDDCFSALDVATEAKLRVALRGVTSHATVFVIAQRISTVIDADRIVVVDQGRIVGIGTHAELLDTNEIYREIVASQMSLEEAA
jgi:ATP-binding cassette, subfamily B, multidrug efflux pump